MKHLKNYGYILGIIIIAISFTLVFRHQSFIANLLYKSGPLAPIVALILYPILAMTPIPTEPITLITTATYGPFISALLAGFGTTTATLLEYFIGYNLKTPLTTKKPKNVNSPAFLIFGRMIPGYGSKVVSFLAGTSHCPLKLYLWTSAISSFAGAFLISYSSFSILALIK